MYVDLKGWGYTTFFDFPKPAATFTALSLGERTGEGNLAAASPFCFLCRVDDKAEVKTKPPHEDFNYFVSQVV